MSEFKLKPTLTSLAVTMVLSATMTACNNESKDSTVTLEGDAKYAAIAQSMLEKMSISEKLGIVAGPGMDLSSLLTGGYEVTYATNLADGKDVAGVAGYINGVLNDDLNIPAIKMADGPAGVRISPTRDGVDDTFYATAWPIGSLLASTWDSDLVRKVGAAQGNEVKEYGVDFLLAPGMNIQRNPLLGRNFEYYSEDPILSGRIAAAIVDGLESNEIGATIKHYVANNAETNRLFNNTIADPRTMREIYLRGFKIAVKESQPWAIMSSYNKLNGTYVAHRKDLMTTILRDEWGFNGLAVSDWYASNFNGLKSDFSGTVERDADSMTKQIQAGNNLIQPVGPLVSDLEAAIENGSLTEADVDKSVVAILTQVQKTPSYNDYAYSNDPDLTTHALLARQSAAEGMILLKNNNAALPLTAGSNVASFGTNQINTYKGGTGSGDVNAAYVVHIADGLAEQFVINEDAVTFFSDYFDENKVAHTGLFGLGDFESCDAPAADTDGLSNLITAAATNDAAAVISFGRQAGEGTDRTNTQGDYLLTDNELALIDAVATAFHAQDKTVTVVLNVNGLVDTTAWADKVDAIVLAYMGGQETGHAVADILSGEVNPSGKLAQTLPVAYADVPSADTFPGEDTDGDDLVDTVYYNEGIYVGYRYYTSFDKAPAYPFGYGLSYTNFDYSGSAVESNTLNSDGAAGSITLTTTIRNSGQVAGKEAAQVYISAPEVKLDKPVIELKAFDKTALLQAGESETLTFTISAETLASFDPDNNQWIVEPGSYSVYIAPSSDVFGDVFGEAVSPVTFTVESEIVVSETTPDTLALPDGISTDSFVTVTK